MSNVIKINSLGKKSVKIANLGSSAIIEDDAELKKKQFDDYYRLGFREGQDKAKRDLEQDYSNKLIRKYEEVYNILQQYDEQLLEMEKSFEGLVIETAHEIAKKIIQREVGEHTIINEVISEAIKKVIGANEVRLKLNPKDLAELTEQSKNILHSSSFNKIAIEGDERIERGGCFIETEIGNVDARVATQLGELKKKLEENI